MGEKIFIWTLIVLSLIGIYFSLIWQFMYSPM